MKDYYGTLNVSRTATPDEIKKAYRKLAMGCHPDRNSDDPEKEELFKELNEAYEVLRDPEKRREYDSGKNPHETVDQFDGFDKFEIRYIQQVSGLYSDDWFYPGYVGIGNLNQPVFETMLTDFGVPKDGNFDMDQFKKTLEQHLGHEPDYHGADYMAFWETPVPTSNPENHSENKWSSLAGLVTKNPIIYATASSRGYICELIITPPNTLPDELILLIPPEEAKHVDAIAASLLNRYQGIFNGNNLETTTELLKQGKGIEIAYKGFVPRTDAYRD